MNKHPNLNAYFERLRQESLYQVVQMDLCRRSPAYFLDQFCQIKDDQNWMPFRLWPAQRVYLDTIHESRQVVALKARQLGMSWLTIGYILWMMLFKPGCTILIFSKSDREAVELLHIRLKGMAARLPVWLRPTAARPDRAHYWKLDNDSSAQALPGNSGRSYTGSFVLVDEADWLEGNESLSKVLSAVEPVVNAGGKLVLLSSVDKRKPESLFKRLYRDAKENEATSPYTWIFLPWYASPGRDAIWYEQEKRKSIAKTDTLDDLQQEYPATDLEALAPRSLDKRIHPDWILRCYVEAKNIPIPAAHEPKPPAIPGLVIYQLPKPNGRYVLGADPAEGNPTSDPSALTVLDVATGEEVASLAGRLQPQVIASYAHQIGTWFKRASIMVERNNHGHAVLLWLDQNSTLVRLCGPDGKPGWLSSTLGKTKLYDATAEVFRNGEVTLHTFGTFNQLSSIEGSTLRAPEGMFDDCADSFALACVGRNTAQRQMADLDIGIVGLGV
jgi:hypothetical protein